MTSFFAFGFVFACEEDEGLWLMDSFSIAVVASDAVVRLVGGMVVYVYGSHSGSLRIFVASIKYRKKIFERNTNIDGGVKLGDAEEKLE